MFSNDKLQHPEIPQTRSTSVFRENSNLSQNNDCATLASFESKDFEGESQCEDVINCANPTGSDDFHSNNNSNFTISSSNILNVPVSPQNLDSSLQDICEEESPAEGRKYAFLRKGEGTSRFKMKVIKGFKKNYTLSNKLPERKLCIDSKPVSSNLQKNNLNHNFNKELLPKKSTFEILEEEVERYSFCSTASYVQQLLVDSSETSLCSSPISSKVSPSKFTNLELSKPGLRANLQPSMNTQKIEAAKTAYQSESNVDKLVNNEEKDLYSHTPKVKFCEKGVKVLEFEQSTFAPDDTTSQSNESDILSLSSISELNALAAAFSEETDLTRQKGTFLSEKLERIAYNRGIVNPLDPLRQGKDNINQAHCNMREFPGFRDQIGNLGSNQAVRITRVSNFLDDHKNQHPQLAKKNIPLSKNEEIDLEAHKLLLLSHVNELNKQIKSFEEKNKYLDEEMKKSEDLSRERKEEQLKLSELTSKNRSHLIEIRKLKKQNSSLQKENQDLKDENKVIKAQDDILKSENTRLREETAKLLLTIDQYKEKTNMKITSSNSYEDDKENMKQISGNQSKIQTLKKCLKKRQSTCSQIKSNDGSKNEKRSNASKVQIPKTTATNASSTKQNIDALLPILSNKQDKTNHDPQINEQRASKKVHFDSLPERSEGSHLPLDESELSPNNSGENFILKDDISNDNESINVNKCPMKTPFQTLSRNHNESVLNGRTNYFSKSFPEANLKIASDDKHHCNANQIVDPIQVSVYQYENGNRKEIYPDRTVYFRARDNITREIYRDGKEVLTFENGQCETYFIDGSCHIIYPDRKTKTIYKDGKVVWRFPSGTTQTIYNYNHKVTEFFNGEQKIEKDGEQKTILTDGTVKIIYPDGLKETRYPNGIVRFKDKQGNVLTK